MIVRWFRQILNRAIARGSGVSGIAAGNGSGAPSMGSPPQDEELYRSIIQSIDGIVWECEADTLQFTYVSPQCKRLLGHDPEQWCTTPGFWQEHIHPDDRSMALTYCEAQRDQGRNHDFEYRMRRADGSYVWLRDIVTVHDTGPGPAKMRGVMFDISREKDLERGLEQIIQDQQRFLKYSPYLVGIANREGYFEMVNPAFTELLGYSEEELTSRPFVEFVHPGDLERTARQYEENKRKGVLTNQFENRYRTKDGKWKWISWYSSYWIEKEERILAYGHDITSLKQANLELKQLSLVASHSADAVVITDPDGRITWVNDAFNRMTGYSFEESMGRKPGEFLQGPGTDPATVEKLRQAIRNREPVHVEILNYTRKGSEYWLDLTINPVFDARGNCTDFIAIQRNVSEQKREEMRLRQLESVITHTDESIAIIEAEPADLPGRKILYVNEGFSRMTGYRPDEVIGKTLHFLNGNDTDPAERDRLRKAMGSYRPSRAELVNYRKNGEPFWVLVSLVPVRDRDGSYTHWISIGREITDRKRQQQQILDSLKEKETLLSEIHHRVKNNLAVISGMMLLQAEGEQSVEVRKRLQDSVGRIKTMATIHEQLYQSNNFSRLEFAANIENLVQAILDTFQPDHQIDLDIDCEPVELTINQAIPCSLIVNEVMTNILKYAFAGRKGGTVSVSLKRLGRESDPSEVSLAEVASAPAVELTIQDDGIGLPADLEDRRSGTLGMNLIDVLTVQLDGSSRFDSPGRGTRFSLRFEPRDVAGIGNYTMDGESPPVSQGPL